MTAAQVQNSGVTSEDDVQPLSEIMCNCDLCYARLCVSARQHIEEDPEYSFDPGDNFHLPINMKRGTPFLPGGLAWTGAGAPMCGDVGSMARLPYQMLGSDAFLPPMHPSLAAAAEWTYRMSQNPKPGSLPCEGDFGGGIPAGMGATAMSPSPQLYLSKESVLHLRLSAYVALERSGTAFRLINYRNNSALALSENGEYGYAYHYNCRGLINMHHEKLSITFDRDRQVCWINLH